MEVLALDGAKLAYLGRGQGDPVVLIHGAAGQIEGWQQNIDDLADSFRVIAYDRRGHGRSTHPTADARIHIRDAAAVIEKVAGCRATVVGWSSGANIALGLAVARPELVRALVVVEPLFNGFRHASGSFIRAIAVANLALLRGRRREAVDGFIRWAFAYRDGGSGWDELADEQKELLHANVDALRVELRPHPFGLAMDYVSKRAVRDCGVPITYLLGEESEPFFHRCHARLSAAVPSIQTIRLANACHMLPWQAPEDFGDAVRKAARL